MFIRKKKVLRMIEDLIEDAEYWNIRWKDDPVRVNALVAEIQVLNRLVWWLKGNKPLLTKRSDDHNAS